jgi:hypothetical protein
VTEPDQLAALADWLGLPLPPDRLSDAELLDELRRLLGIEPTHRYRSRSRSARRPWQRETSHSGGREVFKLDVVSIEEIEAARRVAELRRSPRLPPELDPSGERDELFPYPPRTPTPAERVWLGLDPPPSKPESKPSEPVPYDVWKSRRRTIRDDRKRLADEEQRKRRPQVAGGDYGRSSKVEPVYYSPEGDVNAVWAAEGSTSIGRRGWNRDVGTIRRQVANRGSRPSAYEMTAAHIGVKPIKPHCRAGVSGSVGAWSDSRLH